MALTEPLLAPQDICQFAESLAHSPFFTVVIQKLVVAIIGFICSTYTFLHEGVKWLVHPNAKVLFFIHALITVLTAMVYIAVYSFEFYRIMFPIPGNCGFVLSDVTSFWVRFPMNILFCLQTVIMFTFVVERTISTVWSEEYEKISNPKAGIVICILVILAGSLFTIALLAVPNEYGGFSAAVSAKTPQNYFDTWQLSIAVLEIATMVILFGITLTSLRMRKKLQERKESHLGSKYQIRENRNILLLLLPCFTINGLLHLLSSCGILIYNIVTQNEFKPTQMAIYVEILNQSILYTIIMPVAIFVRRKFLLKRIGLVHSHRQFDEHFRHMRDVWK